MLNKQSYDLNWSACLLNTCSFHYSTVALDLSLQIKEIRARDVRRSLELFLG